MTRDILRALALLAVFALVGTMPMMLKWAMQ